MAKTIIIFETKFGNTRIVAENIALGMRKAPGNDVRVSDINDVDVNGLGEYDNIVIGSPARAGGPTRKISNLVSKLKTLNLQGKTVSFFDSYLPGQYQKVVKKLEAAAAKAPGIKIKPGLSVKVDGMEGPLSEEELPRCVEYGVKFGEETTETPPPTQS